MLVVLIVLGTDVPLGKHCVERYVKPSYEFPQEPLRDRTGGRQLRFVFDILRVRQTGETRTFFIIGDSTVGGGIPMPRSSLAYFLQRELKARFGPDAILIDLSSAGLFVEDALLLAAEASTFQPIAIYYAVNPRVFADTGDTKQRPWQITGRANSLVFGTEGSSKVSLLYRLFKYDAETLASNLVISRVSVLRHASAVRASWSRACLRPERSAALRYLCRAVFDTPPVRRNAPVPGAISRYQYEADRFSFNNNQVEAFSLLLNLCAVEGSCLFYKTPLNLTGPGCEWIFEPPLVDRYEGYLAATGFYQQNVADFSGALGPEYFNKGTARRCDGLHLNVTGRQALARLLADSALTMRRDRPRQQLSNESDKR